MANWYSGAASQKSDFNANKIVDDAIEKRNSTRTKNNERYNWAQGLTVVGINANEISNMINAINVYVQKVRKHLDGINPSADANKAYKGEEVQKAVEQYVNQVKTYCYNLTSQLNSFGDKLADINRAYVMSQQRLAENIRTDAGFDAGSEYKYSAVGGTRTN